MAYTSGGLVPGLFNPIDPTNEEISYERIRELLADPEKRAAALIELAYKSTESCFADTRSLVFRANAGPSDACAILEMCDAFIASEAFDFKPSDFDISEPLRGSSLGSASFERLAARIIEAGQEAKVWIPVSMDPNEHYDLDRRDPDTAYLMHQKGWLHLTGEGWTLSQDALTAIAGSRHGRFLSPRVRKDFSEWHNDYLKVVDLRSSIKGLGGVFSFDANRLGTRYCCMKLSDDRNRSDGHKLPFLINLLKEETYIGVSMAWVRHLVLETMIVERIEELHSVSDAKDALYYLSNKELSSRLQAVIDQV